MALQHYIRKFNNLHFSTIKIGWIVIRCIDATLYQTDNALFCRLNLSRKHLYFRGSCTVTINTFPTVLQSHFEVLSFYIHTVSTWRYTTCRGTEYYNVEQDNTHNLVLHITNNYPITKTLTLLFPLVISTRYT